MRAATSCVGSLAGMALALGAWVGRPTTANGATPTELVYERTLMGAAGQRCGLFTPQIIAALAAGAAQARGAAMRGGSAPEQVQAAEARARAKAAATPCNAKDLQVAAERVRTAFLGYAKLIHLSFPGRFADWRAERPRALPPRSAQWVLVQFSPQGVRPTLFGLSIGWGSSPYPPMLTAVNARPEALTALTARLVMRDPSKVVSPYVDPRRRDLAGRLPPRALDRAFLARIRAPAPPLLAPRESPQGAAFVFPPEATAALGQLDPSEAVALETVYLGPGGERVSTAWIEVGDFAAGQAFLATPRPPETRPASSLRP